MDKIAANNHIVTLRKEIKKAKAMVSGNLIRKMKELREKKDKIEEEDHKKRLDDKIERVFAETKLISSLDSYPIAKKVTLNPDTKYWELLLSNNKATPEERLTSRIILKNNIQKCVAKFRADHPDCDEWLEEYFEYRVKKKELELAIKSGEKCRDKFDKSRRGTKEHQISDAKLREKKSTAKKFEHKSNNRSKPLNQSKQEASAGDDDSESLHPSWASKRREKELLKAALSSNDMKQAKRIVYTNEG